MTANNDNGSEVEINTPGQLGRGQPRGRKIVLLGIVGLLIIIAAIWGILLFFPRYIYITDAKGGEMALVPAGPFTMGDTADQALSECKKFRADCHRSWFTNEEPPHTIDLPAFYMDKYEVTNALYKACVDAGACQPPKANGSVTHPRYYGISQFDNYPVINVDWSMAKTYCEWRGARLPSEAEWEKAARGGLAGKIYSWGDADPTCEKGASNGANFYGGSSCQGDTLPVGSYAPNGYGLYDMAGNVWEWTADWYDVYPRDDPNAGSYLGQTYRVLRGGSWAGYPLFLRVSFRYSAPPNDRNLNNGFRCTR
jgi:formylglycine-generating enzyme required for sulfatase activity